MDWLRDVDAGEVIVIDVAIRPPVSARTRTSKPGPMGDPGLGQLAYDKGIRILVATQGDSVALEAAALHGGLLTFSLTHDGLGPGGAKPDANGDVPLDALLRYALADVPRIERRDASGHHTGLLARTSTPLLVPRNPQPPPPPAQQPHSSDFTGEPSPAAVGAGAGRGGAPPLSRPRLLSPS